jgi:hypothetical protein
MRAPPGVRSPIGLIPTSALPPPAEPARYTLSRRRLADGEETTLYVVRHQRRGLRIRVRVFRQPRRLDAWCVRHGVEEAIVGGFYRRDPFRPLGDLRVAGRIVAGEPFTEPYGRIRPALVATGGALTIAPRHELPQAPDGDLLQAGPLLVKGGAVAFDEGRDDEGFTAACDQFDSDITDGRHPRAAIGLSAQHVTLVACDGRRSRMDDGLTMLELAGVMQELGCEVAMNLDGGGSTTLVHRGHLLNRPYSEQDQPAPASRPIVTALLLDADQPR